jgi:hypothetical protein
MNGFSIVVIIGAIIGAILGLDHEYRFFIPFDKSISFWASDASGALLWGAVFGICVSIAAVYISKFFARYRNWTSFRITFTGGVLAFMAIGVSALAWDYIDASEERWSTGRITRFQTGFEEETSVESIQGNATTEFKQAILNWYTVASRIASKDVTADAPSVLSASTPEYADILGGMLDGSRSYDWDRLTWGDPGEPCRGPLGDPVAFRVLSVDDAEGLVKFKPWDPAKGGLFDRDISIPPQSGEIAFVTATRQITLLSDADDGTIKYRYACPRSEDAASRVIFVLCKGGGIWKVCGQTDTSGLWIAYPYEAMGDVRPVHIAVNELFDTKPFQLAFDETNIWIPNARGKNLLALSLEGRIVRDLVLGGEPVESTVSGDDIWVGTDEAVIVQIPTDGEPVDHSVPGEVIGLAPAKDGIWTVVESNGRRIVGRVSDSGFEPHQELIPVVTGIVSDAERAWVYGPIGLLRVDIDASYETRISRSLSNPIAWGTGAIWARGSAPGYLLRIDPSDGNQSEFKVANKIAGIGTSSDAVWVGDSEQREVIRITPSGTISGRWRVNINPEQILFDGDALWVADPDSSESVVRLPISINTP